MSFSLVKKIGERIHPSSSGHFRSIYNTAVLYKRRGGNSALIVKSKFNPAANRSQNSKKHKYDPKNHDTSVAPRENYLPKKERQKHFEKTAQKIALLDQDEQLSQQYDQVFEEILGDPSQQQDYIYQEDETLLDVNATKMLAELQLNEEAGIKDYNDLMKVYAAQGLIEEAESLILELERSENEMLLPDNFTYTFLISAYGEQKDRAGAIRVLGRMKKHERLIPCVRVYTSAMSACVKSGSLDWAYSIFEKMRQDSIEPNRASFTVLMNGAIKEGDLDKAFDTFHLMRSYVEDPDVVSFTTLINGMAKAGQTERAISLYEDLTEMDLTPSIVTFNCMIHACAKSQYHVDKAFMYYEEMRTMYHYLPDMYTYNTLLYACSRVGDVLKANEIYDEMLLHQVPKDEYTYNTILHTYARAQVRKVLNRGQKPQFSKVKEPRMPQRPSDKKEDFHWQERGIYEEDGSLYEEELNLKDEIEIMNRYRKRQELGIKDIDDDDDEDDDDYDDDDDEDYEDYNNDDDEEDPEVARQNYLLPVQNTLLTPDKEFPSFGVYQTNNIRMANELLDEMKRSDVAISTVTMNSYLSVYTQSLRLSSAENVFLNQFEEHNVVPDANTYRILMRMYCRAKRLPKAIDVMDRIAKAKIIPDEPTYGLIVDFCARKERMDKVLQYLADAKSNGKNVSEMHMKKARSLSIRMDVVSELIPEDPDAYKYMKRFQLIKMRKKRAERLRENAKQELLSKKIEPSFEASQ